MALALDRIRLTIPDHVVTRAVDGTTVVLDIATGRSFSLDDIGTRIWTLLTSMPSAQVAYETLVAEYGADPTQVRADLEGMIEKLTAKGLLSIHESQT